MMIENLDRKVIRDYGSFKVVKYFLAGWVKEDIRPNDKVEFTYGWRGKETHITRNEIYPICVFEVVEPESMTKYEEIEVTVNG